MSYFSFPSGASASNGPLAISYATKTGVAVTGGPFGLFTVATGRVQVVQLFGVVTGGDLGAGATQVRLYADVATTDTFLSAATTVTGLTQYTLLSLNGDFTQALRTSTNHGAILGCARLAIINPSTITLSVTSGGTTGTINWSCVWQPLDAGATLVAA